MTEVERLEGQSVEGMFSYTLSNGSLNVKNRIDVNDATELNFSFSSMSIENCLNAAASPATRHRGLRF